MEDVIILYLFHWRSFGDPSDDVEVDDIKGYHVLIIEGRSIHQDVSVTVLCGVRGNNIMLGSSVYQILLG